MADNRLFLVHLPTGKRICLADFFKTAWYTPEDLTLEKLEGWLASTWTKDKADAYRFALHLEHPPGAK